MNKSNVSIAKVVFLHLGSSSDPRATERNEFIPCFSAHDRSWTVSERDGDDDDDERKGDKSDSAC